MKCRLKELIYASGLSQKEFAERCGLRPNTVSQLVRNEFQRIDADTAAKVCGYFGMQLGEVFYLDVVGTPASSLVEEQLPCAPGDRILEFAQAHNRFSTSELAQAVFDVPKGCRTHDWIIRRTLAGAGFRRGKNNDKRIWIQP